MSHHRHRSQYSGPSAHADLTPLRLRRSPRWIGDWCPHAYCAYVAAVAMTSSQQSLSVIAGSNFAAVDMISLRQSLSVADSKTNLFCVSRCLQQPIATADLTMLQQSLSAIAGSNFAAVVRFLCGTRGPSRTAATWMQPLRAATTSRQSVGILCSNLCQLLRTATSPHF